MTSPRWFALATWIVLAAAGPSASATDQTPSPTATLDVPYLSQTEALCGGAATAMVFRYWGDRYAEPGQFATLVDNAAGGIATTALVRAIQERAWAVTVLAGSAEIVREHLRAREPLILLLEVRPDRYHYVVAVGAGKDRVVIHDPAWGPMRIFSDEELLRAWRPAGYWGLLVRPAPGHAVSPSPRSVRPIDRTDAGDVRLAQAFSEQAGVHFAQKRWTAAAAAAEQALAENPHDEYALDVLGSSRFIQDDLAGSLRAWNRIDKPYVDTLSIKGLTRLRQSLAADLLGIAPNVLLTESRYLLARRRLDQLPDRTSSRIGFRPDGEGFATVEVVAVERPSRPRGPVQWIATGAQVVINRELAVDVPGWTGQGEVWSGTWRWWKDRPRVGMSFAAPKTGLLPGIWRVDGFWEVQKYGNPALGLVVREAQAHVGVTSSHWMTPNWRYQIGGGLDSWDRTRRAMSVGGTLERRWQRDRLATSASLTHWLAWTGNDFSSLSLNARFRSSPGPRGMLWLAGGGVERASDAAPLSVWPGAGEGQARGPLLRAHQLLSGGVVQGPTFGRSLEYANGEIQRWFERPSLVRLGAAAFVDAAHASRRMSSMRADRLQVDVGIGLRVRVPGKDGALHLDYARGLSDGSSAFTIGWLTDRGW